MKDEKEITKLDFRPYISSMGMWTEFTRNGVPYRAELTSEDISFLYDIRNGVDEIGASMNERNIDDIIVASMKNAKPLNPQ